MKRVRLGTSVLSLMGRTVEILLNKVEVTLTYYEKGGMLG
jgi:hypothetical protein